MALLEHGEINRRLEDMQGWSVQEGALQKAYRFDDYPAGIAFVNRLAEIAEEQAHHPDLEVGYGRVVVRISTHSESGLTEKDFRLATAADGI